MLCVTIMGVWFRPLCRQVGRTFRVCGVPCVRCVGLCSLVMSVRVIGFMIVGDRATHVVGVRSQWFDGPV